MTRPRRRALAAAGGTAARGHRRGGTGGKVVGLVLLVVGAAALLYGVQELGRISKLLNDGVRVHGTVSRVSTFRSNQQGQQTLYTPVLTWTSTSGREIEAPASFGFTERDRAREGTRFLVIYDPDAPTERYYVVKDGEDPRAGLSDYVILVVGGVFAVAGLVTMFKGA